LPENEKNGEIIFFDLSGKEVKRLNVEKEMSSVKVSINNLNSGIYFYYLLCKSSNSIVRKLEIIKNN